jgi:hypothetical protein
VRSGWKWVCVPVYSGSGRYWLTGIRLMRRGSNQATRRSSRITNTLVVKRHGSRRLQH